MKKLFLFICIVSVSSSFVIAQDNLAIEEVIVTAEKREANLQDVPMALDVFTASQIEDQNIDTVRDISSYLPSLIVNYNIDPMFASMRLRGIGVSISDTALESDVAFIVDGVYLNKTGLGLNDLVDVERIEVLYGPQGTLYGKNTTAGVINVTTKKPVPGDANAYVEIESGDYNHTKILAAATMGLSDNLALRLSANVNENDGYMTNMTDGSSANGTDDSTVSLKLSYDNDVSSVYFTHTDTSKNSSCCAVDSIYTQSPVILAGVSALGAPAGALADTEYNNYEYRSTPGIPVFNLDSDLTSLKIDTELENGTLTLVMATNDFNTYSSNDADYSHLDMATIHSEKYGDSMTIETRFDSNLINNREYTFGTYTYTAEVGEKGIGDNEYFFAIGTDFDAVLNATVAGLTQQITQLGTLVAQNLATPVQIATLGALQGQAQALGGLNGFVDGGDGISQHHVWSDDSFAVFGRVTTYIDETLRYTVGLRYTSEERQGDMYTKTITPGYITVAPAIAAALQQPALAGATVARQLIVAPNWPLNAVSQDVDAVFSRDDSSTTWSLSVQKDIKEDVMLYARAATGYKPGGFNSTFGLTADTRGFDKAESNNLEIGIKSRLLDNRVQFNAAIFDFEVEGQHYITQDASGLGRVVGNATVPSERLGFEASVIAKILPNLIFNAGLTVIDDGDPAPETNAENRVSPDDAYVLGLSYFQPFMGGKLFSRLDYTYDEGNYQNSSQPLGTSGWSGVPGYPEISQPIEVENLNFKLGWTNDDFEVAYSIKNATDEKHVRLVLTTSGVSGLNGMFMNSPQIQTVSLKYNF